MNSCTEMVRPRAPEARSLPLISRIVAGLVLTLIHLICAPGALAAPGDLDPAFSGDGLLTTDFGIGGSDGAREFAIQSDGRAVVVGNNNDRLALARYGTDGSLDTSFSTDGKLTDFLDGGFAADVAVQSDGKIVVAGGSGGGDFALARYNPDGSPDTGFSGDGKLTTDFGDDFSPGANSLAIQADGKIVAVGEASVGFGVVRYQPDGSLDPSFSGDGMQTTDFGYTSFGYPGATGVAVQSDGRIVAVGETGGDARGDFAVARYNADGTLDTGFSADGTQTTDFGGSFGGANDVALQSDGKIVAAGGGAVFGPSLAFTVARYGVNGTLDLTFSGDGKQTIEIGVEAEDVALQADGKLVVTGRTRAGDDEVFGLVRLTPDGLLDTTFSGDGKQTTDFGGADRASGVALGPGGQILVAGVGGGGFGEAGSFAGDFALARYSSDGSLDSSFSDDGKQTTDFSDDDSAAGVALQPDGKIVLAGTNNERRFAVARYNPDGSLDTTFSGDGVLTTVFSGLNEGARDVAVQSDGKIVVAGGSANQFAVARYLADGSLDTGFSADGKALTDFPGLTNGANAHGLALAPEGKIVVVGRSAGVAESAIARYNPDGSLDPTFSADGLQTTPQSFSVGVVDVALQADGKIVAAGEGGAVDATDFGLVRYNADGSLDQSFSDDGMQRTDFGAASESAAGVALQADGKIVAVGHGGLNGSGGGSFGSDFAIARYNPNGSLDGGFSGDGKQTTDIGGVEFAEDVAIQGDGRIVAAGTSFGANGFAVVRYGPDGALDLGFSADGKQTTDVGVSESARAVTLQPDGRIVAAGQSGPGFGGSDFALARFEGGSAAPDTTPPETSITSGPSGATDDATPAFGLGSSEAGSSFECRVDGAAFALCSSPHMTGPLGDGQHTFEARAIDAAGNVDPTPASRVFTVARIPAPPADSDGDGVLDASDACPTVRGGLPNGCPSGGGNGGGTVVSPSIAGPASAGSVAVSSRGAFTVRSLTVNCGGAGPACSVTTTVTGNVPAGASRRVKLGGSSFRVTAGKKGKVRVKLTRKGLRLLKRLKRIKTKVTISVRRGGATKKKTVKVTLKAPKPKRA